MTKLKRQIGNGTVPAVQRCAVADQLSGVRCKNNTRPGYATCEGHKNHSTDSTGYSSNGGFGGTGRQVSSRLGGSGSGHQY